MNYSRIEWGVPAKDNGSVLLVEISGQWKDRKDITGISREQVLQDIAELYKYSIGKSLHTNIEKWVLNDFGHMAVFMAEDKNKNTKFDKDFEKIHPQFFHTTKL